MGIFQTLKAIIGELIAEFQRQIRQFFFLRDPQQAKEDELRLMYGRGLVDRERYFELLSKLRKGWIGSGDLALVAKEAASRPGYAGLLDPGPQHTLDRLHKTRGRLAEMRAEVQAIIEVIEKRLQKAEIQAEELADQAREALPDEDRARGVIEARIRVQERSERLEARLARLRAGQERIQWLADDLDFYEDELFASHLELDMAELEMQSSRYGGYIERGRSERNK